MHKNILYKGNFVDDITGKVEFTEVAKTIKNLFKSVPEIAETYQVPRTISDLHKREAIFRKIAKKTYGLMGRTPDYLNVGLMTMAHHSKGFQSHQENLKEFYFECMKKNSFLTHSFRGPQVDRSKNISELKHNKKHIALKITDESKDGVYVSGTRNMATMGPYCDELLVLGSGGKLNKGEEDFAISFAIPVATEGLKVLNRPSYSNSESKDKFFSKYFDEVDSVFIFDNVFIPNEKIFIKKNIEISNNYKENLHFYEHVGHQVLVRYIEKLNVYINLSDYCASIIGVDQFLHVQERIGDIIILRDLIQACLDAAVLKARPSSEGVMTPDFKSIEVGIRHYQQAFPKVLVDLELNSASAFVMTLENSDIEGPLANEISSLFAGKGIDGKDKLKVFKCLWELTGSGFASRQRLFERFFLGDPVRTKAAFYKRHPKKETDEFMQKLYRELDNEKSL